MNPVAFSIFGFEVRWYGVLIASGMLIGVLLADYSCKKKRVSYDNMLNMVLISLPAAIIGARLYYVIFNFSQYNGNLIEMINIREGGLAIHGGVLFGLGSAYIYSRIKKLDFIKFADAAAPSLILAQSIGRWGNFFNSEAHGGPVSYEFISHFPKFIQKGMYIDGIYYHPTFLYESIWNFVIFLILISILKREHKDGTILFSYIGLYSLGRFFIEGLRTDSLMLGPIRVAQLVSIIGVLIGVSFFIINRMKRKD